MLPIGRGTAGLFTRDLPEKLSRLLFITSLYIYPRRVNRAHLALPHFVLPALSPVVMNKTRPDGPQPGLFVLFPWGSKLSPGASVASPTGPLLIPSMVISAFAAPSSSYSLPTGCPQELV